MKKIITSALGFLMLASVGMTSAFAQNANAKNKYLALGDSLAFGYNPLVQPPSLSKYVGYPSLVSKATSLNLANASCPGETSGTLSGTSTTFLPGFECPPATGLFVDYNGAASQLDFAIRYLKANTKVKLVTINIGVNDLAILLGACTAATPTDPVQIAACGQAGLPAVLATFTQNLITIYKGLRSTGGYSGPIIMLNAFAFNYTDQLQVGAFTALNQVISAVSAQYSVSVIDEFRTLQVVSAPFGGDPCKAGLLLRLSSTSCDTHPSLAGQALLAASVITTYENKH